MGFRLALRSLTLGCVLVSASTAALAQTFGPPVLVSNDITGPNDFGNDVTPELATDGAGTWVATWETSDSLGGTIGIDGDILFARSTDDGVSWSDPQPLHTNAGTDNGSDTKPHLATDGAGNWIAVWASRGNPGGTLGTDGDIVFVVSTDDGATWSDPAPVASSATTDTGLDVNPRIATDTAGNWVVAWESTDTLGGTVGSDRDIFFAKTTDLGATWTPVAPLNSNASTDSGADRTPTIAAGGAGTWIVAWDSQDSLSGTIGTDRDILYAVSGDDGSTWTAPSPLQSNAATDFGSDFDVDIATDGLGNWIAVWISDDDLGGTVGFDLDPLFVVSTDDGGTWSAPDALSSTAATNDFVFENEIRISTDREGTWIVAWSGLDTTGAGFGDDYDVFAVRSVDVGATWSTEAPVNSTAAGDGAIDWTPAIAADGADRWILLWISNEDLNGAGGLDADIFFSTSADDGAGWSASGVLNTNAPSDFGFDEEPSLATDGAGTWLLAWHSADTLGDTIGDDDDILFSRSTDAGATWTAPAPLNSNAASDSGDDDQVKLVCDGNGVWVAIWRSEDELGGTIGDDADILFSRSTDAGATWSAPAMLHDTAAIDDDTDRDAALATDGAGTWIAVWSSEHDLGGTIDVDRDVFYSVSSDGGVTWGPTAVLNTNAGTDEGSDDSEPDIATDGSGAWMVVWDTQEPLLGATVQFDREIAVSVSSDDGATWSAPAPVNTSAGIDEMFDRSAVVATDAVGTWMVLWESGDDLGGTIGTDTDVLYAVSTDEGATWTNQAAVHSRAALDVETDEDITLASGGAGTWIAAWSSSDDLGGTTGDDGDIHYAISTDDGATWSTQAALHTNAATDLGGDLEPTLASDGAGTWVAAWQTSDDLGGLASFGAEDIAAATTAPAWPCGATPIDASGCLSAPATKLLVSDSGKAGKDKLLWQWGKGDAFDQSVLGTPTTTTGYALCVYDTTTATPSLALALEIEPSATLWTDNAPKGLLYNDKAGSSNGVAKVLVKPGALGKGKVKLQAKGAGLVLPGAAGATYFDQDPRVVAQLVTSDGTCWTSEFEAADTKKHDATKLVAQTK